MSLPPSHHRVEEAPLLTDRLGTRRSLTVHRFGTPGARPKVYIQAALHADETPGLLVAHHLIRRLRGAAVLGEIIVVPMCNPTGIGQIVEGVHVGRYALDGSGNFNRIFPDLIEGAAERLVGKIGPDPQANVQTVRAALRAAFDALPPPDSEVAALRHTLMGMAFDADMVLDLHCDQESVPHLYAGDALWPELADLTALLGAKAVLLSPDAGGKPFDEACSVPWWTLAERFAADGPIPAACVATTIELRGKADVTDVQADADAQAIIGALIRRGIVAGTPPDLPPLLCDATPLTGLARVVSPVSGVVAFHRAVGDQVAAGDLIADIVDPTAADPDQARTPLRAPGGGIVMARNNLRFVSRGELVASIAGPEPLESNRHALLFD